MSKIEPQSANALTNLANLLTQMGRLDESLKLLREALRNDSNFAPAHRNLVAGSGENETRRRNDQGLASRLLGLCRTTSR